MDREKIVYKKVSELHLNEKNPRKNDAAVDIVAKSIQEFGFKNPLIIDSNGKVWCGNTRLKASKKLGLEEVPCIVADDLTEEQIRKLALIDNKSTEIAEWDMDLLMGELSDLDMSDFDLDWGIENNEPEREVKEDNFDIDTHIPEEPKSKPGEIYKLGEHRLMCGDSTNEQDVEKLMNGELADLLYTDPPYNVDVENSQGMKIENDNMNDTQFREFLTSAFYCANLLLKAGGAFYCWHGDTETVNFRETLKENGLITKQCLIWVKNSFNFGRQDYKWQHEPCLYGWKEGAAHYFIEEYNHPTVIEDKIDVDKLKKEEMKKLLEEILATKTPTTVIHEDKPIKNDLHPTMKPLQLCANMIRNSSKPKEIVADLFGGSGSTLMACEQIGRKCYMMEYDPKYVDVIISRWEEFTGKKAEKLC